MVRSSTARFPISLLRRFVEQINLMAWQFSWVALSLARTQAFLFIIGLKDEGCKTQTQTDIYIYHKCVCVLLLLQKPSRPPTTNKIKKKTTILLATFSCLFSVLSFCSHFFPLFLGCLLQLRKIPICSKFCDFSFIRTYKTFLVSCWLFLFLPSAFPPRMQL